MTTHPTSLVFMLRTACAGTSTQIRPRHRILVLVIVILTAAVMVGAGYEIATAVGAILAVGIAASEVSNRLLGPARDAALPCT